MAGEGGFEPPRCTFVYHRPGNNRVRLPIPPLPSDFKELKDVPTCGRAPVHEIIRLSYATDQEKYGRFLDNNQPIHCVLHLNLFQI